MKKKKITKQTKKKFVTKFNLKEHDLSIFKKKPVAKEKKVYATDKKIEMDYSLFKDDQKVTPKKKYATLPKSSKRLYKLFKNK